MPLEPLMSYYTYTLESSGFRQEKKGNTSDLFGLELNLVSNYKSLADSGHFPIAQNLIFISMAVVRLNVYKD